MNKPTLKQAAHYLHQFMHKHELGDACTNAVVGVSGGVDSVFLAHLLATLRNEGFLHSLKLVYINHGTRKKENNSEQRFVFKLAQQLEADFESFALNLSLDTPNFEKMARVERYKIFQQLGRQKNVLVYLGHQLDDSFEWSLMQQFKSSNPKACLGIPLVNGPFRRPLMCFTKEQITWLSQHFGFSFIYDSSNSNLRFERNFIREKIVPYIKHRYPKYLKHYAQRSNRIALEQNCLRSVKNCASDFFIRDVGDCCFLLHPEFLNDFSAAKNIIYQCIQKISETNRGSLSQQVDKLLVAAKNHKSGPLSFSGGVKAFILPGMIIFSNRNGNNLLQEWDEELAQKIKCEQWNNIHLDAKHFIVEFIRGELTLEKFLYLSMKSDDWPNDKKFAPLKKAHPLLRKSFLAMQECNITSQWLTRFYALGLKN